jgi:hypothetical protein
MNGDRGFVEIGIGHDDYGVLSAHFASDFGAALRRLDVKCAADFIRSGKRNGSQHRRVNHRFADDRARSHEHVEYARRKTRFGVDFREQGCGGRRQLRRLEDNAISRRQGGRGFPHRNCPGEIPRRDQTDDAERLSNRIGEGVARLGRQSFTVHAKTLAGVEFQK